jgi:hypothetical protein
MKAKTKKANKGLTALAVLRARVPSVGARLRRINRALMVMTLVINQEDQGCEDIQIDPIEAELLIEMLREANDDAFWLMKLSPSILKTGAPDDDDRSVLASSGGVR